MAIDSEGEQKMYRYVNYWIVGLLTSTFLGCTSHDIRQLSPDPISAYPIQTTENGVTVAADPFSSKQKCEQAFTMDLTEEGYVPILLVFENQTQDNVLLVKDDIELVDSRGNVRKPVAASVMVSKFEHNKIAYALLGFGIFSYMSAEDANKKMLQDWSSKELPAEKVLIPGRKAHGVIYLELGPGLTTLPNSKLIVPLLNMRTGERKSGTLQIVSQ
jgi:hypothetical protein